MSRNITLPLWSLWTGREFTLGAVRKGAAAETFQPHCKQSKSEVKTPFPAGRGHTHTQCFKKELASKMDLQVGVDFDRWRSRG